MKILGIIAEYNPFHNGHFYHVQQSQNRIQPDATVAVMSPSFVQRGEPAIVDKWLRTEMALQAGIDLVLELPFPFACSSAEHFAWGGITLLKAAQCTHISFGCEEDNQDVLEKIAGVLAFESRQFSHRLKTYLDAGHSFPKARSMSIQDLLAEQDSNLSPDQVKTILKGSNNILAIEYLKALQKLGSPMKTVPVQRQGPADTSIEIEGTFASATAIRQKLKILPSNQYESFLYGVLPQEVASIFLRGLQDGRGPVFPEHFFPIIAAHLRCSTPEQLQNFPDMERGLENRLFRAAIKAPSYSELLQRLSTKRYVLTRLQRILVYVLVKLQENDRAIMQFNRGVQYIRPLGFNAKGQKLLRYIKNETSIPVFTRIQQARIQKASQAIQHTLLFETRSTDLLSLVAPDQRFRQGGRDYREKPLVKT